MVGHFNTIHGNVSFNLGRIAVISFKKYTLGPPNRGQNGCKVQGYINGAHCPITRPPPWVGKYGPPRTQGGRSIGGGGRSRKSYFTPSDPDVGRRSGSWFIRSRPPPDAAPIPDVNALSCKIPAHLQKARGTVSSISPLSG